MALFSHASRTEKPFLRTDERERERSNVKPLYGGRKETKGNGAAYVWCKNLRMNAAGVYALEGNGNWGGFRGVKILIKMIVSVVYTILVVFFFSHGYGWV